MNRFFVLLLFVVFAYTTETHSQTYLKVEGTRIVNGTGGNVLLRGMGLGGWMLQEGYMLRLQGANPQYVIKNRIKDLVGPEKTEQFYQGWLQNFITKADIDSMRAWGFNSVRLPMHYNLYTLPVEEEPDSTRQTWLHTGFALTDSLLSWCKANRMYLILDLHAAPGGQGNDVNISDRDTTKPSLWQSPAAQAKTIALWKKLAERYKDEPAIGAYDLLNEPNWGFVNPADRNGLNEPTNAPLCDLLVRITEAIRSVDQRHIIIIEGNGWGNNYRGIFPLWDKNTVISFHKYWNPNTPADIKHIIETREQQQAPVWLGETGENSNTWFTGAVRLLEDANIGWSWWPLKKMGFNNPLEVPNNPGYQRLLDYWHGKTELRPSAGEAWAALSELVSATHLRKNRFCADVVDALFRQPYSVKAVPFAAHVAGKEDLVIPAVHYDLGRNGVAYADADTGNYDYGKSPRSVGNRGRVYRNDGVDIYPDSTRPGEYYIGQMEAGEWLQYTVEVSEAGSYQFRIIGAGKSGALALELDGKTIAETRPEKTEEATGRWQTWTPIKLRLTRGRHIFRVYVKQEGPEFKALSLHRLP